MYSKKTNNVLIAVSSSLLAHKTSESKTKC